MTTKEEKLKAIKEHLDDSPEDTDTINKIYKIIPKPKKKVVENKPIKIIDTTTPKYKTLLKLINKFLMEMGKDKIKDLLEFQNIKRTDIISVDRGIIKNMEKKIIKHFKKGQCFYRKDVANYNLNVLRYLVKKIGLNMVYKKKNMYIAENNKAYVRSGYLYSIKNI
jgi:hypothetical protein